MCLKIVTCRRGVKDGLIGKKTNRMDGAKSIKIKKIRILYILVQFVASGSFCFHINAVLAHLVEQGSV